MFCFVFCVFAKWWNFAGILFIFLDHSKKMDFTEGRAIVKSLEELVQLSELKEKEPDWMRFLLLSSGAMIDIRPLIMQELNDIEKYHLYCVLFKWKERKYGNVCHCCWKNFTKKCNLSCRSLHPTNYRTCSKCEHLFVDKNAQTYSILFCKHKSSTQVTLW